MVLTHYEISAGTVYPTVEDAKNAVLKTIVVRGESLKVKKSDKKKWIAVCRSKDYFLRIRVSDKKETKTSTICRPHACPPEMHSDWPYAHSVRCLSEHH